MSPDIAEHVTIKVRQYRAGYVIRTEAVLSHLENEPPGHRFTMKSAYTPSGDYIGDSRLAYWLCTSWGVKPEKSHPAHKVCSIGFSEREQKWFGWSHRTTCCFGIGSVVRRGDCAASSGYTEEYLLEHPEEDTFLPVGFTAHTLEDAKKIAIAFAEAVS